MKIHITLVGGQPAPVYNGIVATHPDKIVFIYSDGTREIAERIAEELKNIPSERRKFDPVDLNEIERKVLVCAEQFKDDNVTVNISGGTKPWAFYFAKIFGQMHNATLFYTDQNNILWNLTNKTPRKILFDMDNQFRILGHPLNNYVEFACVRDDDKKVLAEIDELLAFSSGHLFKLITLFNAHPEQSSQTLNNGSSLTWTKSEKQFEVTLMNGKGKSVSKKLKSTNVRSFLLNAGWFEYKVAELLSKWERAKDIRMNCVFPFQDSSPKNEIDIIVDTGSKLLFVECKNQIKNLTDIDKFNSAVKNYGGLGSKALFVTNSKMEDRAIEKCTDNGILTFSLSDNHLGLSNEKALVMLLESELFNINTK